MVSVETGEVIAAMSDWSFGSNTGDASEHVTQTIADSLTKLKQQEISNAK